MKISIFVAVFLMPSLCFAGLKLTDEQFQNVDVISQELRKKDANFIGLEGSKDDMKVYGISEEQAKKEIDKMDFSKLKDASPKEIKRKALIAKFEKIGFDAEMLEFIGLKGGD